MVSTFGVMELFLHDLESLIIAVLGCTVLPPPDLHRSSGDYPPETGSLNQKPQMAACEAD